MKKNDYEKMLDQFTEEIYEEADRQGWTWKDFAKRADIHLSTLSRIGHYHTRLPRLHTIFKLARSVGMVLQLVRLTARMKMRKAG